MPNQLKMWWNRPLMIRQFYFDIVIDLVRVMWYHRAPKFVVTSSNNNSESPERLRSFTLQKKQKKKRKKKEKNSNQIKSTLHERRPENSKDVKNTVMEFMRSILEQNKNSPLLAVCISYHTYSKWPTQNFLQKNL